MYTYVFVCIVIRYPSVRLRSVQSSARKCLLIYSTSTHTSYTSKEMLHTTYTVCSESPSIYNVTYTLSVHIYRQWINNDIHVKRTTTLSTGTTIFESQCICDNDAANGLSSCLPRKWVFLISDDALTWRIWALYSLTCSCSIPSECTNYITKRCYTVWISNQYTISCNNIRIVKICILCSSVHAVSCLA